MHRCKWVLSIAAGVGCLLVVSVIAASAQSAPSRLELAGQVNVLRLSDSSDIHVGVGGRLTLDLARWFSVEGEYQFIPSDELDTTIRSIEGSVMVLRYERRRSTALFGVKTGHRGARVGVFGKVRPGFTVLTDRGIDCVGEVCALVLLAVPDYRAEFALDVGGVVEFYPSSRWTARVDVGSLVITHRSSAPPCAGGGCTTANLATSVGVGVRFE